MADPTFPVVVLPGPILCGKCRQPMRFDDLRKGATHATGSCVSLGCEQHDVPLAFPLTVMELQRAN